MRRSVGCRRQEVALRTAIVVREGWTEGSEPYVSSALQDEAIQRICSFPRPPEDPESRPPPQSGSDEGDTDKAWHRIASSLGDGPPSGEGEVRAVCRNILHSPHAAAACPHTPVVDGTSFEITRKSIRFPGDGPRRSVVLCI